MRELLQKIIDNATRSGYYRAVSMNCDCRSNPCACMMGEEDAQEETKDLLQKFLDKYEPKE